MLPYLTVPFKLTEPALAQLDEYLAPFVDDYQKNAPLSSALVSFSNHQRTEVKSSLAWSEIINFLSDSNIKNLESHLLPQLFIYKQLNNRAFNIILGNPHIDTDGGNETIDFRFNILLTGDENTEMAWWKYDRTHANCIETTLVRPDGKTSVRIQAAGASKTKQWKLVGEPEYRARFLGRRQEFASFLRTDRLHAINWSGENPRLVLSIRFTGITWEDFISNQTFKTIESMIG